MMPLTPFVHPSKFDQSALQNNMQYSIHAEELQANELEDQWVRRYKSQYVKG